MSRHTRVLSGVRSLGFSLLIAILMFSVLFVESSGVRGKYVKPPSDDWPMFHYDLSLSGVSSSLAPNTNETRWIYNTGSPIGSSPAVVNGILYIGCDDGTLYAINADAGTLVWSYETGALIRSSPAVESGRVYFLSEDGNMYALDAVTGALVWNTTLGPGLWDWSSPAIHNGHVFVGISLGWMYCLDSATGSVVWNTSIGGQPDSPITVANGKVYSGTHNFDASFPTLVALDEQTGTIIWTYNFTTAHSPTAGMINCNGVAVVDGDGDGSLEVYFGVVTWGGAGNEAVCLNESTGNEKWTHTLNGWSTSTPAVHNGVVFIGSDDCNVYALNASSGNLVWKYATQGWIWAAPAVADGKIFVGSLDHTFYALNESTGELVWSYYTFQSRILGSPAVANGKVFVGNENGNVYAFGPTASLVVRGQDNRIYYRFYNSSSGSWDSWSAVPSGSTCDSPAAAVCGNELHVVVRGMDGNTLWHGYVNMTDGAFSGWTLLSGSTPSAPTLTSNGTALSLVVRGQNNLIYYRFYECASRTWTDWAALPSGATCDSPAATILGNKLHVVVRGMDGNTLWHSNLDLSTGVFSGWDLVGGATESKPTLTACESRDEVCLVVRGLNNVIYRNTWSGSAWAGWVGLPGGSTCDGVGAAVFGDKLNVVVRSLDGNSLWHGTVDLATGSFTSWTMLSGSTQSTPTLTS